MDIRLSGKNMTITTEMKEHLEERIYKFERYAPRLVESHVILRRQKYFFDAQITLAAKNFKAVGEGQGKENVYVAIDQACERVEKQLKKFREKVKDHHNKLAQKVNRVSRELPVESSLLKPEIVKSKSYAKKPLSSEEAARQLELNKDVFLVFMNSTTRKVNVIYKQDNDKFGLIEPEF